MLNGRLFLLLLLGAGAYALAAYSLLSWRAPFSFTEIFENLTDTFASLYSSIFD